MENICKICGAQKEYHEKGFRKDGTQYEAFWGCPNYRDDQHREAKEQWKTRKPTDLQMIMGTLTTLDKGQREIWKLLTKIYEDKNI